MNHFSSCIFKNEIEYCYEKKWKSCKLLIYAYRNVEDSVQLTVDIKDNTIDDSDSRSIVNFELFGKDVTAIMEMILFSSDELHIIRLNTYALWNMNDVLNEYGLNDDSYFLTYVDQNDWLDDEKVNHSFVYGHCYRIHLQEKRIIVRTNNTSNNLLPKIVACWPITLLESVELIADGLTFEFSVRNSSVEGDCGVNKFYLCRAVKKDAKEILKNINKLIERCAGSTHSDHDDVFKSGNQTKHHRKRNCNSSSLNNSYSIPPIETYSRTRTYSDNADRNRVRHYSPTQNYSFCDSLSSFGVRSSLSESLKPNKTTHHNLKCSTNSTPSSSVINDRIIEETIQTANGVNDIFSNDCIDFKSFGGNQELMFMMDNNLSMNNDETCLNQTHNQNNQKLNGTNFGDSERISEENEISNESKSKHKMSLKVPNISSSTSAQYLYPTQQRHQNGSSACSSSISTYWHPSQSGKLMNLPQLTTHRKCQSSSSSHRHYAKQNSVNCTCKCTNGNYSCQNSTKLVPYSSSNSELSKANQYNSIPLYYNIYATPSISSRNLIKTSKSRHSLNSLNINSISKHHDYYNIEKTITNGHNNNNNNNNTSTDNSYYNLQHNIQFYNDRKRDENAEIIYAELDFDTIVPNSADKPVDNDKPVTSRTHVDSKSSSNEGPPVNYTFISCENTEALNHVDNSLSKSKKEYSEKKNKKSKSKSSNSTKFRINYNLFGKFKEWLKLKE